MGKPKVLFVCIENSCRSQMAEAFAKEFGEGRWEAWSAGSRPSGAVNATAIELMKELEIDMSGHRSKGLEVLPKGPWDCVVTMGCGDACPHLLAKRRDDWALRDPQHLPLDAFREVRDEIGRRVRTLLSQATASPD